MLILLAIFLIALFAICRPRTAARVNWHRGFFRLWLVGSVLWVSAAGFGIYQEYSRHQQWGIAHTDWEQRHAAWKKTPPTFHHFQTSADPDAAQVVQSLPLEPKEPIEPYCDSSLYYAFFLVPAGSYAILRTLAWILGGFGGKA